MFVYITHVVRYCLSISFVLVKYDQNAIYISFVIYYFYAFQPLFYVYFFEKLKVISTMVLEMGDPMAMPFSGWKNWLLY